MDDDLISLAGPVEKIQDELVLRIPLEAGGDELSDYAAGISRVDGEFLVVTIPDWLAQKLGIDDGSMVHVDNRHGKFNITLVPETIH